MKLFLASLCCLSVALGARLENTYLPPNGASGSGGNGKFLDTPNNYGSSNNGATNSQSPDARAAILRFDNENNGDGSYSFAYETENQISAQESGELRNANTEQEAIAVQGSYSYVGPDGVTYTVNYVADENGFRATGDHLPTPPPIPEEILKSLEQNAAEEQRGSQTGGSYSQQQDSVVTDAAGKYQAPQAYGQGNGNSNGNGNNQDGYRY